MSQNSSRALICAVAALLLTSVPNAVANDTAPSTAACAAAGAQPALKKSKMVPAPTVEGPVGAVGVRTKKPYLTTIVPLAKGWVEEEFLFSGVARSFAADGSGTVTAVAPYKSRIMVRRPTDPKQFNGSIVLDWNNVTVPHDKELQWAPLHPTFMKRGFMYVSVAAQMVGVQGGPLALKFYDPVRYGSLTHPGDDYSFDIYSQAAEAVLDKRVLGTLKPCAQRRLAMGASQSGGRLATYINNVHESSRVFDGFQPQISGAGSVRRDLVPVLWVNSTAEVPEADLPADSGKFRLWEIAGPAHVTHNRASYEDQSLYFSQSNGLYGGKWDRDEARSWGYRAAAGDCLRRNYFDVSYQWAAALVRLDEWVRTGKAPKPLPRAKRDSDGRVFDEHGNLAGGVRSPMVDVPIATYFSGLTPAPGADPCGAVGAAYALNGTTKVFDAAKLKALYPTPAAYLRKFESSTKSALAAGTLLPEDAVDLRKRAREAATWLNATTRS